MGKLRIYLEENALDGSSNVVGRVLSFIFVAMQSSHGPIDNVLQVSSGAIVTNGLPDETRSVEQTTLKTQNKWHPLIVNYKKRLNTINSVSLIPHLFHKLR